jgi:hypothetical protein
LGEEIFYPMKKLCVLAERSRVHNYTVRPDSSLGYNPPASVAWLTEASQGHGKVEIKERFPLFHNPDYGDEPFPLLARYANNPTGTKHRADKLTRRQEQCSMRIGR